ncbi:xanthine dehydrogenase family protein molybdopterin-binding subunit [Anaerocolumna sp.]|uniref:xanthine dehydrogenase family protein molybdopterin-binding subunit n=1 Tax=Anaerocolumna sp. TaxID=2041569 RepID=UPI0028AC9E6D|nr:xanthine dehydrogenase family protein molybdopterin-binding subunit [Anaerocolumna sp.]
MEPISKSVVKKDHFAKVSGQAMYVADYPQEGVLFGKFLRSSKAKARIVTVTVPKLPEGYFTVDKNDVPGINRVAIVKDDTPVYANETVEYIGEPILMVVGPVEKEVLRILSEIVVEYEELEPVVDIRKFDTVFFDYNYGKGDVEKAFAEADKIYEEEFETGYQEQAYLETQGLMARVHSDGKVTVNGSMQCPYYVHGAVAKAMGFEASKVQIIQDVTGGGFGGKEAYPSILACQVAVAAYKAKKPVRVVFDRREDMEFTSKRHPSLNRYKVAVKDNKVTAMDIDVLFNGGAYTTLSAVVLQRGIICSNGVYNIDNLRVRGRAVKTNTVPCGAYRGFGAPQTFFSVEMMMNHIANDLSIEPLTFKKMHLVKQGDPTSTSGKYHFPVPVPAMIEEIEKASDFSKKHALYSKPQSGRYRRGIGISLYFHGAGFTGSGERDIIKAVTKLHKYPDGTVEILASNSDIGQGLKTTFSKIVANELNIPLERVICENPDTDRVPDSGPTVASRSLMTVGELLRKAAIKLRSQWVEGEDQIVEEHFKEPDFVIPFYIDKFQGDAYPTYAWGVVAVEVEVDTLTATNQVLGAWGSFDVGTPIDMNIVVGQMEGGLMQGIGYSSMEYMATDSQGRIRNNSFSDYIIPTAVDVPNLEVIMHVEKYPLGPYGAKGAGELPLVGVPGAYVEALEQAVDSKLNHAPFTYEDTMKVLKEAKR